MDNTIKLSALLMFVGCACAQQASNAQNVQAQPQPQSASLLGVRYSAATDVSHTSFNSPSVTYGDSLNQIQLPAAPIQPANLRQAPQQSQENSNQEEQQQQQQQQQQGTAKSAELSQQQQQLQQQFATANPQPQFISIQQYPANPQLQAAPQSYSLNQNLPATGARTPQQQYVLNQPQEPVQQQQQQQQLFQPQQQQYFQPQPQQYFQPQQQQYATQQPQQQYLAPQTQSLQPYVAAAQPQQLQYSTPPANTGYFATGPFAAQFNQPNLIARQQLQYPPTYPQQVPSGQLVSRVAFNRPTAGFSYSF